MIKKTFLTISLISSISPILVLAATFTPTAPASTTTTTTNSTGTTTPTEVTLDPNAATNFATWFETHPTTTAVTTPTGTAPTTTVDPVPVSTSSPNGTTTTSTVPPRTTTTTPPRTTVTPPRQTAPVVTDPVKPEDPKATTAEPNCPSVSNPIASTPCPTEKTIIPFISPLVMGGSVAGLLLFWLIFNLFNRLQLQSLDKSLAKRSSLQSKSRNQELKQQNQINFLETAVLSLGKPTPEQHQALQKQISLMEINGNDQAQINTAKNVLSALDQKDSKTAQKLLSELTFLFKH